MIARVLAGIATLGLIAGCMQVSVQPLPQSPVAATPTAPVPTLTVSTPTVATPPPLRPSVPSVASPTPPPTTAASGTPSIQSAPPLVGGGGSLVYVVGSNIWLSAVDGSNARQLTSDGTDADNYHDPSQADDGTIFAVKGNSALYHFDRAGQPLGNPVTLATLEHGAEGVAVSPDAAHIAYTTVGTGQYVDPRFGTPTGTFFYGGTDVANPDGSSVAGAVLPNMVYASWVGVSHLVIADGVDIFYDEVGPAAPEKLLDEQDGCLTDFDCPPGQDAAASLSTPTISDDGTTLVYSYIPYFGPGGRRMSSVIAAPPVEPQTRCLIGSTTQYIDTGSLSADGSLFFFDGSYSDSTALTTVLGEGISVMNVDLDATDCGASSATLILPGAAQPDWGPAAP